MARSGDNGRKDGTAPMLALSLSNDAVALFLKSKGDWSAIGTADIAGEDFKDQIAALRGEALVRDPSASPVLIWLPPEQVLTRDLTLTTRGTSALTEAARAIAAETDFEAEELTIAVALEGTAATGTVPVMAALVQTVHEARTYVTSWGFKPGPVSTRDAAKGFGPNGPVFTLPPTKVERAAGSMRRVAIAAGVAAMIGGGLFGAYHAMQPLLEEPIDIRSTGPKASSFAVVLDPLYDLSRPLDQVQVGKTGSMAFQRRFIPDDERLNAYAAVAHTRPPPSKAAVLTAPPDPVPMSVGSAPKVPAIERPGRLAGVSKVTAPSTDRMRAALGLIREEGRLAPSQVDTDLAAKPPTPSQVPGPGQPDDQAVAQDPADAQQLAALDPEQVTDPSADAADAARAGDATQPADAAATPDDAAEAEGAADLGDPDVSDLAPAEMDDAPAPRPNAVVEAAEAEAKARAEQLAAAEAKAKAEAQARAEAEAAAQANTATPAAPDKKPTASLAGLDQAQDPKPEAETDAPTEFAALSAPKPSKRPRIFERAVSQPKRATTLAAVAIPRSVQSAAKKGGLALDQTSLIGILDARSGRQALVRTPDGAFRKVSRGDVIDGWRVSAINREAMRLTRRGQNRTLLLVSR